MKRPALWIAVGHLLPFAMALLLHLGLWWLLFGLHAESLQQAMKVLFAASVASIVCHLVVLVGLSSLLRSAFGIRRIGAFAWALASLATGLWPLAALLPAARRLGNRSAARLAAWGGLAFLLAWAALFDGTFAEFPPYFAGIPSYWPFLLLSIAGTGATLAALRRIDHDAQPLPHRILAAAYAAIAVVAIATQPSLHAARMQRKADAAREALIAMINPQAGSETAYCLSWQDETAEDAQPPSPADEAIAEGKRSFGRLRNIFEPLDRKQNRMRLHPFIPEERALLMDWLDSHTSLVAAGDAISSESGVELDTPGAEGMRDKPHFINFFAFFDYIRIISLRTRMELSAGDGSTVLDAFSRIERLAAMAEWQSGAIPFLSAEAMHAMSVALLDGRIDLWDDEALRAAEQAVDDCASSAESRFRNAIAGEIYFVDIHFTVDNFSKEGITVQRTPFLTNPAGWIFNACGKKAMRSLMSQSGAIDCWIAAERLAWFSHLATSWEQFEGILAATEVEPIGEAIASLEDDNLRRGNTLPPLARAVSLAFGSLARQCIVRPRNRAALVHAAIAAERYRRDHGEPPPSLDALVPDYLPAVPRDAGFGKPLRYEPGPLEIPEETFPELADPDALARTSWNKPTGEDGAIFTQPEPAKRTLPAMTLPGFCIVEPSPDGKAKRDFFRYFVTPGNDESAP